jgi:hypothetical protein
MYSKDELVYELEQTYEQMQELINNLDHLVRYIPDGTLKERARRMMLSHFQMALNNDHMWLGGNMYTLSDLIEDMQDPGMWDEGEEEDEMKEAMEESFFSGPFVEGSKAVFVGNTWNASPGTVVTILGKNNSGQYFIAHESSGPGDEGEGIGWVEASELEPMHTEETIQQTPTPPMEESCGPTAGQTYLVVANNLLANIGCQEVAEAFAQFLNDKGIAANVHPVGSAIAKDAMAVRTDEIAKHVQMYMQEFAESEYNPMRQ